MTLHDALGIDPLGVVSWVCGLVAIAIMLLSAGAIVSNIAGGLRRNRY